MLYRGDGPEYREPVDSALDVGSGAKLISQHLGHSGNLVLRGDDKRDHTGAIAKERERGRCFHVSVFVNKQCLTIITCVTRVTPR